MKKLRGPVFERCVVYTERVNGCPGHLRCSHVFYFFIYRFSQVGFLMKRFWIRLGRTLRFAYLKILRIKAPPHSIALGMAVGVFVGCLPVIPFQTLIALAFAVLFRCNKLAAALGTWVSNPANVVFVYYFLYRVGEIFVPGNQHCFDPEHLALAEMLRSGWHLVMVMTVGGVIVGIPAAVLTYFLTVRVVRIYHRRRAERRLLRNSVRK